MWSLLPATSESEEPDPEETDPDNADDSEQFEEEDHAVYGSAFPEQTA